MNSSVDTFRKSRKEKTAGTPDERGWTSHEAGRAFNLKSHRRDVLFFVQRCKRSLGWGEFACMQGSHSQVLSRCNIPYLHTRLTCQRHQQKGWWKAQHETLLRTDDTLPVARSNFSGSDLFTGLWRFNFHTRVFFSKASKCFFFSSSLMRCFIILSSGVDSSAKCLRLSPQFSNERLAIFSMVYRMVYSGKYLLVSHGRSTLVE